MIQDTSNLEAVGLEVIDAKDAHGFSKRRIRERSVASPMEGMQRIAHALVEEPAALLQELVDTAVSLCNADSAGISLEKEDRSDAEYYRWIATAGQYSPFLDAVLPLYPSACTVCLERGQPQRFRVGKKFFDLLGITAPLVTDGILLPWQTEGSRGTIFVMAHGRDEAFDYEDCRTMEILANFAAMAVKQQNQRRRQAEEMSAAAAAAMANELAHQINNPLQSLTNHLFMASQGYHGEEAKAFGTAAAHDLERLTGLVSKLLQLPREIPK
jgi:signal transduction histidine kinase